MNELQQYMNYLMEYDKRKAERNDIFEIYREFEGRYAVLIGGSGSGKSYEAADKTIDRIIREDGHRMLCVRAERKQVTESMFPLIKNRIKKRYNLDQFKVWESIGNEKLQCIANSNEILFAGLDDVEKLKSIFDITSIWIEEADKITVEDLRELNRRLRGYEGKNKNGTDRYMQISLSFNPVSVLNHLKKRFFDNPEPGQIMLHGRRPFTSCVSYMNFKCPDLNEKVVVFDDELQKDIRQNKHNTLVIHSTYLDNKFCDENYHKEMKDLKEQDEGEYNIYALGQWGITGGTFFNKDNINRRILDNPQPLKRGYFEFDYIHEKIVDRSIKWIDDPEGYIKLYELPKSGYPYVGAGDTAGEGSDFNTGYFTNNITGYDAAVLKTKHDEDLYARQMYCLGKYYGILKSCNGDALIGIETKFSTHPVKELMRLGYSSQYIRDSRPDDYTGKLKHIYGFDTNTATRPLALGLLRTLVREHPERIKDIDTLYEMTTFVKNEQGKPEAARSMHDDLIMARAINCAIAHQGRKYIGIPWDGDSYGNLIGITEDAMQDYSRASKEGKAHLVQEWKKTKENVLGIYGDIIVMERYGERVYI